jgi:hypothetical protein
LSQIAVRKDVTTVLADDIIMIPLVGPTDSQTDAGTFMVTAPIMFVRLVGVPQPIMMYGTCAGFYGPVSIFPFMIGESLKLPSLGNYFTARPGVVEALTQLTPDPSSISGPSAKRVCARPLEDRGEQTAPLTDRGTLKLIKDLEGGQYITRNKTDLEGRERDLNFLSRALDKDKREYVMGVNYLLQTEKYRILIVEEAMTRTELRKHTFASCGLYDRVFTLRLFTDPGKLKLFLTENVLSGDPITVTLLDFMGSQQLSEGDIICPNQNNREKLDVCQSLENRLPLLLKSIVRSHQYFQQILDSIQALSLRYSTMTDQIPLHPPQVLYLPLMKIHHKTFNPP